MRSMLKLMFATGVLAISAAAHAETHDAALSQLDARASFESALRASVVRDLSRSRDAVTPYNFERRFGTSSPAVSLTFDKPLGMSRNPGDRYEMFGIDGDFSAPFRCGRDRAQFASACSGSVTHAGVPAAAAPEIDARFGTEGALLLIGGLIVLRARRRPQARAIS